MKELYTVTAMVFLAELGDKTQLATVMFASSEVANPWLVFFGASLALVAASAFAVLAGQTASHYLTTMPLKLIAGIGFIAIGVWMVLEYLDIMA